MGVEPWPQEGRRERNLYLWGATEGGEAKQLSKLVHLHIMVEPELDEELRSRARRHGDISKMVNQALQVFFSQIKLKELEQRDAAKKDAKT